MAKSTYNFTKEDYELLRIIMRQLNKTQKELTYVKKRVQRMLDSEKKCVVNKKSSVSKRSDHRRGKREK